MASPPDRYDELEALRRQVAALTARVYELEKKAQPSGRPPLAGWEKSPDELIARGVDLFPPSEDDPADHPSATGNPDFGSNEPRWAAAQSGVPAPVSPAEFSLEKTIGQYWLNRVGIIATLIGVSYFLKYAFENNWIDPAGRILIGLFAGIGLILWSERFRKRGHAPFSYSLKTVGVGTLYLSLWAGFQIYELIPAAIAFVAMAVVTAGITILALAQNAELLASFALVGGFATPLLLSTGENHEVILFSYICLLDAAILVLAATKPWRRLLLGSFAGTVFLYTGWYSQYYSSDQRALTVLFVMLFAGIFAAIPVLTAYSRSTMVAGPSITLTVLPLANAAAFFMALFAMYQRETTVLAWYSLGFAVVYLGISAAFKERFLGKDTEFISLLHLAIAIAFVTISIPLKFNARWITIGWLIESAALLWISVSQRNRFLYYLAGGALGLGITRLLFFDRFQTETLVFNERFITYVIAIAVLAGIARLGKYESSRRESQLLRASFVVLNFLALVALTLEASDYFYRQMTLSMDSHAIYHQLLVARGFTYSAIWLVYGAALMAIGLWRRSAFVRWQSLLLIAVTIAKVFLYDVSQLGGSYRIVSFIALGAVLLAISYIYQRDWLKLPSRSSD
jgi:uncharacterized membrane protein